jgi:hypothetical protein
MPGAKWYSQPDRPDKRVLGAFDPTMVADDDVRKALEQIQEDLRFLQQTCPNGMPVYGLRAHCWNPELTRNVYGAHHAHFNTTVLSYRGPDGNRNIWLPDAVHRPGGYVEIVDAAGNSATANIKIKTLKGQKINKATGYTISTNGAVVCFRSDGSNWLAIASSPGGSTANDHGTLAGLTDDDHTQYALLLGRSGGQELIGGTASGNNLRLQSTSHATRGEVQVEDVLKTESGRKRKVRTVSATTTLAATDQILIVSASATINVPNPATFTNHTFEVVNVHSAAITIGNNGFNINNAAANVSLGPNQRAVLDTIEDGSSWVLSIGSAPSDALNAVTQAATSGAADVVHTSTGDNRARQATPVTIAQTSGNMAGVGTLASGAHTITVASTIIAQRIQRSSSTGQETYVAEATTATSATVNIDIPVPTNSAGMLRVSFNAVQQGNVSKYWSETRLQNFQNSGGTAAIGGAADTVLHTDDVSLVGDGATVVLSANGANARIAVTAGGSVALHWGVTAVWENVRATS